MFDRSLGTRRAGWLVGVLVVLAVSLVAPATALAVVNHDTKPAFPDIDARGGAIAPTAEQRTIVANMGAAARWNRFGTPSSLMKYGGLLATGYTGAPATAARNWIRANKALFRLTDAEVTSLELINEQRIEDSPGRAVLFRQKFGTLAAGQEGLITVGVNQGRIFYASSSIAGSQGTPAPATISAAAAFVKAAQSLGRTVSVVDAKNFRSSNGWTVFSVTGFDTPPATGMKAHGLVDQRARLVAVPTPTGAKAAWLVYLTDYEPGKELGIEAYVDARTGAILMRYNRVMNLVAPEASGANALPRSGSFTGTTNDAPDPPDPEPDCGAAHPITVDQANRTIDIVASGLVATDDIVLKLYDYLGVEKASADTLFSPEAIHYDLPGGTANTGGPATATWSTRVCEYAEVAPFPYTGAWATGDVAGAAPGAGLAEKPAWRMFGANPLVDDSFPPYNYTGTDIRLSACWYQPPQAGPPVNPPCNFPLLPAGSKGSPWDYLVVPGIPSFTSIGNNAVTAESWISPLTPGPFQQRPVDFDRTYGYADSSQSGRPETWTDSWNDSLCNPAGFGLPQGHDVMAATINLFADHNRHHDWTYHLGFTELNYNAQTNNYGRGGLQGDPEIGDAQAGALTGSRNNANQFIVPDGVPGITNQYLWEPIPGVYPPCADGNYDMIIVGHEYGHLVNNRMIAGPVSNMAGHHGRSMSESWSDQNGLEYVHEYKFVPVSAENPWAMAAYATGDQQVAIRNYALNSNPLQFGDLGYDPQNQSTSGHSDGEVWSAVNFDLRQALVNEYNVAQNGHAAYPEGNAALQRECADGVRPAELCPGNRRWIQVQYDSYLLQANPAVSMLDMRDTFLAADLNRSLTATSTPWPSNQTLLWRTFAQNGFGCSASTVPGGNDVDPIPAYNTPAAGSGCGSTNDATVTFDVRAADQGTPGNRPVVTKARIFVSHYEARVTPVADMDPATPLDATEKFTPGTYTIHVNAPGYGHYRYTLTVTAGQVVNPYTIHLTRNWASTTNGGDAIMMVPPNTNGTSTMDNLLDDTEDTQWEVVNMGGNTNVVKPFVIVKLGQRKMVRFAKISGVVEPATAGQGGRVRALRRFRLEACDETGQPVGYCSLATSYTPTSLLYESGPNDNAPSPEPYDPNAGCQIGPPCPETHVSFPAHSFRPVAPDMLWRAFDVPLSREQMATHVRLIALDNQCTGEPRYQGVQSTAANTDCDTFSSARDDLGMSELQIFEFDLANQAPGDPAVLLTKTGPATAKRTQLVTYTLSYTNAGPAPASSAKLTDTLPSNLNFVSASDGGTYNSATRTVTWSLGTVLVNRPGTRTISARVDWKTPTGTAIVNQAQFTAPLTVSLPAAAVTIVVD
ncbi:MAG: M36 family metallopeptidase [Gaiellaceae bacterium]